MTTKTLSVFDPAMCCSTGVCGPDVDPQLVRFSPDLEWLRAQGVAGRLVMSGTYPNRDQLAAWTDANSSSTSGCCGRTTASAADKKSSCC